MHELIETFPFGHERACITHSIIKIHLWLSINTLGIDNFYLLKPLKFSFDVSKPIHPPILKFQPCDLRGIHAAYMILYFFFLTKTHASWNLFSFQNKTKVKKDFLTFRVNVKYFFKGHLPYCKQFDVFLLSVSCDYVMNHGLSHLNS